MKILLTGGAGFIGSSLSDSLLKNGHDVVAIDNFDPFYSIDRKKKNLEFSNSFNGFKLQQVDIADKDNLFALLDDDFDMIVHLAAKAGVLPSIKDPIGYYRTNVTGTLNLLEFAKVRGIRKFVFASSSSVYGVNTNIPWSESDTSLVPISPYASSKIAGEHLGRVYSTLNDINFIGLRFFTVFGPRQRPDLAINKFTNLIHLGKSIPFYGDGSTRRDYTFIDDIVSGIIGAMDYNESKFEIFNLGNNFPVTLNELIQTIEKVVNKKAILDIMPFQPGDVPVTYSNIEKARKYLNFEPSTKLEEGISKFYTWYLENN
jgi:UDP-glucuronate 4-epimerase